MDKPTRWQLFWAATLGTLEGVAGVLATPFMILWNLVRYGNTCGDWRKRVDDEGWRNKRGGDDDGLA